MWTLLCDETRQILRSPVMTMEISLNIADVFVFVTFCLHVCVLLLWTLLMRFALFLCVDMVAVVDRLRSSWNYNVKLRCNIWRNRFVRRRRSSVTPVPRLTVAGGLLEKRIVLTDAFISFVFSRAAGDAVKKKWRAAGQRSSSSRGAGWSRAPRSRRATPRRNRTIRPMGERRRWTQVRRRKCECDRVGFTQKKNSLSD